MISTLQKWVTILGLLLSLGCSDSVQHLTKTQQITPEENALFSLLSDSSWVPDEQFLAKCTLDELYFQRSHKLVWHKKGKPTAQTDSMLSIIRQLPYFGLIPDDYHLRLIEASIKDAKGVNVSPQAIARLDLYLTDALVAISSHLKYGRIEKDSLGWKESKIRMDSTIMNTISGSLRRNDLLRGLYSLEPGSKAYQTLKATLRSKLDSLGAIPESEHRTRIQKQILDLAINMEQWRLEGQENDGRYILVNIPAFKLEVKNGDSVEFVSKVVVGTPYSQTPVLDAVIPNLILYPTWNVPRDIATRELLPKVRQDSNYLVSNRYRVLDMQGAEIHPDSIDWTRHGINNFPFMFQQTEGPFNALGLVKFTFTNKFNVYLHDTNAKRFFDRDSRALSHGCVRVERAMELAEHLVDEKNPFCSPADLARFIRDGKNRQVNFNPIDLRIRYYTCETLANGTVIFHSDIYGLNTPLIEAIYCRRVERTGALLTKNLIEQSGQPNTCL